jgi:hypothetical protein
MAIARRAQPKKVADESTTAAAAALLGALLPAEPDEDEEDEEDLPPDDPLGPLFWVGVDEFEALDTEAIWGRSGHKALVSVNVWQLETAGMAAL